MSSVTSQLTQLQTNTAINESKQQKKSTNDVTDANMFLKLMLKQMEQQDPTEPTDNSQWLAQMAQYSSLEAMNNLNSSFGEVADQLKYMNETIASNASITQTLSLVGKDVTLNVPKYDDSGHVVTNEKGEIQYEKVEGTVTEASFADGTGYIKVGDKSYPIGYVDSIKNPQQNPQQDAQQDT